MKITPVMERYILHWGEMGTRWGVNRTVSQIHALLYLSPEPMTAEAITQALSVARSNVSTSLKELQSWGLVGVTHVLGDRRDYFEARGDTWEMLVTILNERKKRELDPTLTMLRQCVLDMENDKQTPAAVKENIQTMMTFVTTLSEWFDEITVLPRSTLVALMKLGGKVARAIPVRRRRK
ncbi:MAG: GbsR/MarR family transcriptional regulator [Gammaproteobacteria bacterium]